MLPNYPELLNKAVLSIPQRDRAPSPDVVEALLTVEKMAKKAKYQYNFEQLLGKWRLCWITGTKKTRQRAGIMLGAGRYLPNLLKIQLSYSSDGQSSEIATLNSGYVENSVQFGFCKISLTGPVKFLTPQNILAFDFTRIKLEIGGIQVYSGTMRGGKASEMNFAQESIRKQAFFSYFLVTDRIMAARGRGGGLALWEREN